MLIPKQIHRLRLRRDPAVLHQSDATPRLPRVGMAASPRPRRQRHGNPGILRRARPCRKQAARHPVAVHAIPAHALSRAKAQASAPMGSRDAQLASKAARPRRSRHRRHAPYHPSRSRRPSANERRPAQTRVPAVQRRFWIEQLDSQRVQRASDAGQHSAEDPGTSWEVGFPGHGHHLVAIWLAALPDERSVHW